MPFSGVSSSPGFWRNDAQPNNPYMLPAERALSANDQRLRFVFSGRFDLPFGDEDEGKKPTGVICQAVRQY